MMTAQGHDEGGGMIQLVNANALHIPLADKSVNCVVTSPPYWALRDYGVPGQLGLEPSPLEYVENMVNVFREVWRVLADNGTLWLNLGDSYMSQPSWGRGDQTSTLDGRKHSEVPHAMKDQLGRHERGRQPGIKPKDMVGIPWRVAFALQADGWYLRSDIIWHKPNPMPESVTDRPTKAHEYLFLLAKSERYYYDNEAVKEDRTGDADSPSFRGGCYIGGNIGNDEMGVRKDVGNKKADITAGRNRRTVWTVATEPTSEAHFATYPRALIEPCIKAGTSERGNCPICGAAWVRVTESGFASHDGETSSAYPKGTTANRLARLRQAARARGEEYSSARKTTGWRPTCSHEAQPVPAIILDPFAGSGTTGIVARAHGRRFVGLDLSFAYLSTIARKRLDLIALDEWENGIQAGEDGYHDLPLFTEALP